LCYLDIIQVDEVDSSAEIDSFVEVVLFVDWIQEVGLCCRFPSTQNLDGFSIPDCTCY
jgi:hypothetical protein